MAGYTLRIADRDVPNARTDQALQAIMKSADRRCQSGARFDAHGVRGGIALSTWASNVRLVSTVAAARSWLEG